MSAKVESRLLLKDTQLKEYDWNDFFSPSPNPSPSVLLATARTTSSCNPTTTPETLRTSCPIMSNHVLPPYPSQVHVGSWSHSPKHPPPPPPQFHQPSTMMVSPAPGLPQPVVTNVGPSCPPPAPAAAFSSITLRLPRPLPPRPEIVAKSHPLPSPPHMLQQPKRKPPHSRSHQPNCQSLLRPPPVPFIKHGEAATNRVLYDRKPPAASSLPIQSTPNSTLHLGNLPSLPPGPPPTSQCPINGIQNQNQYQPPEGQLSGLLGSLMAKGLISLPSQPTEQVVDFQPVEFDSVALKVRHESTVRALYADLPRQCKTCGLRFKTQAEHSTHMDWHVTKNRASKNSRHKPSRKWFVSDSNWLRGAQALPVADQAVSVFFAADPVVEKNQEDELVVPADEHQNACALCREPFDYFFSEETDDWMYRGAVYLNAPNGIIAGMDGSHQLGPIVHAKCGPNKSSVVPTANCAQQAHAVEEHGPSARKRRGDDTEGDLCTTKRRHCY